MLRTGKTVLQVMGGAISWFVLVWLTTITTTPIRALPIVPSVRSSSSSPSVAVPPLTATAIDRGAGGGDGDRDIVDVNVDFDASRGSVDVESVKNLRPIAPGSTLYRSATLDDLTERDAERLRDGSAFGGCCCRGVKKPLAAVIDLRNADEIAKGKRSRTDASRAFYGDSPDVEFATIPILGDVDAFWEEAISSMDPKDRWMATLRTAVVGGALDRAAARHLEQGGLPLLYAIAMTTGGRSLATALDACLDAARRGPVLLHCQKGKDRTGILAMLLQTCLDDESSSDAVIVEAYARSGDLLGELPNQSKGGDGGDDDSSSTTSAIDWSYFRGSPASAMEETLAWTRQNYGSVEGYMDSISFGEEKRAQLRTYCQH